ncbi:MAG: IS1380 family transposase [Pirellulales bacterium]
MKDKVRRQLAQRKKRIARRLERKRLDNCSRPVMAAGNAVYEIAERATGTACGGIGAIHAMGRELGLAEAIDERLHLLKLHLPYHESDHVLSLAYNALCGGTCLEDLELRRQDEAFLNLLGAQRIPDPTTSGDFCRRFTSADIDALHEAYNHVRCKVWSRQPAEFLERATIDMDGTLVETGGECKQGMDISYDGTWGFHPLVVSLAETGEVLRIVNRSGNRPSHEGAAAEADRAIALCAEAGFRRVLLRGDTDFSQTQHLDRWNADQRVRFIFGYDCHPNLHILADELPSKAWKTLQRPARYQVKTKARQRPENVKQKVVEERGYVDKQLVSELVAEFEYQPTACEQTYRMVVLRKNLKVRDKQQRIFDDYIYFFYITNDRLSTPGEIVFSANDRCDQENLHAQLKGGVRALTAPVDNLASNGAYMAMASLAWNLKAWYALLLPEGSGPHAAARREEKRSVRRMEFKTFVNYFIRLPCQVVRTGRRIVCRLLAWNARLDVFFRFLDQFQRPSAVAASSRRRVAAMRC